MSIDVVSFQDVKRNKYPDEDVVVTVSVANGWSRGLSPFYLGPCQLWGGHWAEKVESAWQFSKLYAAHAGSNGQPTQAWLDWAVAGWANPRASRYPIGKGVKPLCSCWRSYKSPTGMMTLDYVTARKWIYIPIYSEAVLKSSAWPILQKKYAEVTAAGRTLYLVDFDVWPNSLEHSLYSEIVSHPTRSMGHSYVLAMMLTNPVEFSRTVALYVAERDAG